MQERLRTGGLPREFEGLRPQQLELRRGLILLGQPAEIVKALRPFLLVDRDFRQLRVGVSIRRVELDRSEVGRTGFFRLTLLEAVVPKIAVEGSGVRR